MDPNIIFIDAGIALIITLLSFQYKTMWKHERRISKIEDDLYMNSKNPAKEPLTKKLENTYREVLNIKKDISQLDKKLAYLQAYIEEKRQ